MICFVLIWICLSILIGATYVANRELYRAVGKLEERVRDIEDKPEVVINIKED